MGGERLPYLTGTIGSYNTVTFTFNDVEQGYAGSFLARGDTIILTLFLPL